VPGVQVPLNAAAAVTTEKVHVVSAQPLPEFAAVNPGVQVATGPKARASGPSMQVVLT
jgi:hypothetical protein